jgi:hypothetical protein
MIKKKTYNTESIKKNFDYLKAKKKSHPHHIIPEYSFRHIKIHSKGRVQSVLGFIDRLFTAVPFYFSLAISMSGLFLLFFIFLHHYDEITAFENEPFRQFLFWEFYAPKNKDMFYLFYGSLFFYVIVFVHSIIKFFYYVFEEVRSAHIYTLKVEKQCILGISLFIISEAMLFFAFFWAFFHTTLTPSFYIGNC